MHRVLAEHLDLCSSRFDLDLPKYFVITGIKLYSLQVTDSITRQEQIIAEVQDLYQPFIQERGGSGGAREEALKSIASVR